MSSATATVRFADSPNNQQYADVLIRVQSAICSGDEAEAVRLCDEAIDLAEGLSVAEVQWMQWLSSDLESLCQRELLQENPYSAHKYWVLMAETWTSLEGDPDSFLSLLRFKQDKFSPARMAYARGRAYGLLGFLNVGTVFMRMAAELDPGQTYYKMALLTMLNSQQRFDELDRELNEILTSPITDPDLVVTAAAISFNRTIKTSADVARPYLGEMRRKLQRIFDQNSLQTFQHSTAVLGLQTLGSIQDKLNRPAKAQELYRRALQLAPQNQAIQIALAMSLLRDNEPEAFQIFTEVAKEGTPFEIAYLFAAKHAGQQGLFAEAVEMAEKAVAITKDVRVRAFAYEILGISEAEVNGPTDKAAGYFSEALRLLPDNTNIQANYNSFQEELSKVEVQPGTESRPEIEPLSNQWLMLDTKLAIEVFNTGGQANEDAFKGNVLDESEKLNLATTDYLRTQSQFVSPTRQNTYL